LLRKLKGGTEVKNTERPPGWIDTPLGQIYAGSGESIREIIEETVNMTVAALKAAGMLKDGSKSAAEKTEELLRNYPTFRKMKNKESAIKLTKAIDAALDEISDDPYSEVIWRFYFDGESRESIALEFGTTATTISRNKKRLLNLIAQRIFTKEVICELFL